MSVPNRIQSPLAPLDELRDLVADHLEILVTTERDLPQHHATVANLVHQFEQHLTVLVATDEITIVEKALHTSLTYFADFPDFIATLNMNY